MRSRARSFIRRFFALVVLMTAPATDLMADDRSTELMRYECSNVLGRRDITLFANGTVRLRQGLWDKQELYLDELLREELSSYVEQLRGILLAADPPATDRSARAPHGDWVDSCEIRLDLPDLAPATYSFSTLEVTPLAIASLIHVAEDLADFTRPIAPVARVPDDYEPRWGDVLITAEGERFKVVGLSAFSPSVELDGLDTPLHLYVLIDDLSEAFTTLEPRDVR